MRAGWLGACRLGAAVVAGLAPALAPAQAAPAEESPVAWLRLDPVTRARPFQSITVEREGRPVNPSGPLLPCDLVSFRKTPSGPAQVTIGTLRGGRVMVLDERRPSTRLPCGPTVPSSTAWLQALASLFDQHRHEEVLAGSRGGHLEFPALADQTHLVQGRRALSLRWLGGRAPYRVVLTRAGDAAALVDVKDIARTAVVLPEVELVPGRYTLQVFHAPVDGSPPELRDDDIHVVPRSELPAPPPARPGLDRAESLLLYAYFLEGSGDARWTLEAVQLVSSSKERTPAIEAWLARFGGNN